MKKGLSLILLFVFATLTSKAQDDEYTWHNFNTSNSGLLSDVIQTLAINHLDGSVWVAYPGTGGTGIGMAKFDNGTWFNYNSSNSGLPNNDVRAIAADHDGIMWFACYNAGIVKFDGTDWTLYNTSNSDIVGDIVTTMEIDSDNNLWVGAYANGISKFDGTNWTSYTSANAPFQNNSCVNDIVIDDANNVWVGMECDGALARLDETGNWTTYTTANSDLAHDNISSMIKDTSGNLWIGYVNQDTISRFDGSTWVTYTPFESASNSVGYDGFAIDSEGDIWCHTNTDLYEFSDATWSRVIVPQFGDADLLSNNITNDAKGNIWWGSYSGLWTNNIDVCDLFLEGLVSQVENHLVVSDDDALYQWRNCTTDEEIPDANNQEFVPDHSGTYAVNVLKNGCSVTSACFVFTHCEDIVNAVVSKVDDHLIVAEENAVYQWTNCTADEEIAGATDREFVPQHSGMYAVDVTKDGCSVTSACFEFTHCEDIVKGEVSQVTDHLIVSDEDAVYQWKDCTTDEEIPGASNREFVPTHSGLYAVNVLKEGCSITSACFAFTHCSDILQGIVSREDDYLIVSDENAEYQWIDCETEMEIEGATNQAFTPQTSGNYQVRVSTDNCTLTSECFVFTHPCESVIEAEVSQVAEHLVVSDNDADYQWIDCATSLEIPGATGKTFAPEVSGNYSVRVSKGGCVKTSMCNGFTLIINGLPSMQESSFQIFPNPATHQVTIDLGKPISTATISIKGSNGMMVMEGKIVNKKDITFSTKDLPPGVYFVFIRTGSSLPQVKKLLIE